MAVPSTGVAAATVVAGAAEPCAPEVGGGDAVFDPDDEHPATTIPAPTTAATSTRGWLRGRIKVGLPVG